MSEEEKGSGVTFDHILDQLYEKAIGGYRAELAVLRERKLCSKKMQGDLEAGFGDGWGSLLRHLKAMGVIVVQESKLKVST